MASFSISRLFGIDPQVTKTIRRVCMDLLPGRMGMVALSIICMIGVAGFTGALAYSTKLIVNDVFVAGDSGRARVVALGLVFIAICKAGFEYSNAVVSASIKRSLTSIGYRRVFSKHLRNSVAEQAGYHPAAQMAQIRLFAQASAIVVVTVVNKLSTDLLTVLALIGVMVMQDPLMSLASAVVFPFIFFLVSRLTSRIRNMSKEEGKLEGAIHATGTEAIEGIKTVKSYGMEDMSFAKFSDAVASLEGRLMRIAKITSLTMPVMEILGGIMIAMFVVYASWQTVENGKTPGEFTAFITAFLLAYQPAERLSKTWVGLQKNVVHAERMYGILDKPDEELTGGVDLPADADSSLVFEDVSFAYTRGVRALKNVSFQIAPGERVAIVGRSGAGKSTLVDLVLGFCRAEEGRVLLGGTDLSDVSRVDLRRNVAYISQDVFLFDGTIRENIAVGRPGASEEDVMKAAERAAVLDFCGDWDLGLETEVGPHGSTLSGGQKQRIAIARALLKHALIYIFDEATSALDGENERLIMEGALAHTEGATMLFVTHRPSTLQWVDKVLMLDHGEVIAMDTHAALSAENETYRALFHLNDES